MVRFRGEITTTMEYFEVDSKAIHTFVVDITEVKGFEEARMTHT